MSARGGNEIQQRRKLCLNEAWFFVCFLVGNAHRFHELVPTLTHVTNGRQFFRRLALFINVDTTNDFPPYYILPQLPSIFQIDHQPMKDDPPFNHHQIFLGLLLSPPFVSTAFLQSFLFVVKHLLHYLSLFKTPSRQVH